MRRRLRWWLVACAAFGLILAGLAGASWLAFRAYGPALARERLEEALTQALDRPVRIQRVILQPWRGRLQLVNLRVDADSRGSEEPLLLLGRLQIQVGISSLWRREVVISRILAEDVLLRLVSEGDDKPPPILDIPEDFTLGPISARIRAVGIQRARVTYQDRRKNLSLEFQDLVATARPLRRGIEATLRLGALRLERPGLRETVTGVEVSGWIHQSLASVGRATAEWRGQEIRVEGEVRQPFDTPELHLAIRAGVDLAQLPAAARGPEPLTGLARGELRLDGPLEAMRASGRIAVPVLTVGGLMAREVRLSGEVRHAFSAPDLDLAVGGSLDLASLPRLPKFPGPITGTARLEGKVRGQPQALTILGSGVVPELAAGPVRARDVVVRGQWSEGLLDLAEVSARIFDGTLRGSLVTRTDRPGDTRATLALQQVSLDAVEALLPSPPGVRGELDLDAQVEGDLRRPEEARGRMHLTGRRVALPGDLNRIGAGTLTVEGTLRQSRFELSRATGDWTGIRVEAAGGLRVQGPEGLRVTLGADLGVTGPLWGVRGLAGQATLRGDANGRWEEPEFSGQLRVPVLTVAGTRIDGVDVPVRLRGRTLHVDSAAGTLGRSRVILSGDLGWSGDGAITAEHLGRSLRFRAEVRAPDARWEDLAQWLPPAWQGSGRFGLSGHLEGNPAAWRASGALEARSLTAPSGVSIQDLRSTFTLDQDRCNIASLRAQVHGIPVRGTGGWAWAGSGQASAELGPVDLAGIPNLPPRVALRGTGRARVQASLRPGSVEASGAATLERVAVLDLPLGNGSASFTLRGGQLQSDLAFPEARITGTARGRLEGDGPLAVRLEAREFALAPLLRATKGTQPVDVDGTVTAVAEFTVPLSQPSTVRGTVRLDPLHLEVAGEAWTNRGPVVFRWAQGGLSLDRMNLASRLGSLEASGRLDPEGVLDGRVTGQFPLAILPALRPEIREAGGLLEVTGRVSGTATAPQLAGEATVRGGRLLLRNYPDAVRDLEARISVSPQGIRLVQADGLLGRGQVRAVGELTLDGWRPGTYRLALTGRGIPVTPVERLQTVWDLDLELLGQGVQAQLRGGGRLVRGSYTGDLSLVSMLFSERPGKAASTGPGIILRILLRLDNNFQIQTNLARLRVDGTASLEGTTREPLLFGRLESRDGRITFRNRTWTVTSAAARFTDPRRFDPLVDVTATSRIRSYDVTMQVSGRSEELTVRLSSKPPLPEQEILALVTVGDTRPPTGQSGAGLVAGEMLRLVVDDLLGIGTSSLGLDMVSLGTVEEAGKTKMQVGAQLSDKVQVVYSQTMRGSFKRLLRVEYQLLGPLLIAGEQNFEGGYGGDVFVRLRFR